MDTRFWGPSGWRFLHLVSFADLPAHDVHTFFLLLPYVLPCKFCRASLADYYCADPVPRKGYAKWLYRIHNRVNGKLRDQKLLTAVDPSWDHVRGLYTKWLRAPCSAQMVGWDFLYSVAHTTPSPTLHTTPMPGAPPNLNTPELRNRWGVMSWSERLPYIRTWWTLLPRVLPFKAWRDAWPQGPQGLIEYKRRAITSWLYTAEMALCRALQEEPHRSFSGVCKELHSFSSGCGKTRSARAKTCRSKTRIGKLRFTRKADGATSTIGVSNIAEGV